MVHEPGHVPLGPSVYHPVAVYGEVVVVLLTRQLVCSHPLSVFLHGDQLPNTFIHKLALLDDPLVLEPPTPPLAPDHLYRRILPLLEAHVPAQLLGRADSRVALEQEHPVEAVAVLPAGALLLPVTVAGLHLPWVYGVHRTVAIGLVCSATMSWPSCWSSPPHAPAWTPSGP